MFVLIHVCQDMSAAEPDDYEDPETVRVAKRARADGGGVVPHNVGGESETDYDDEKPGEVVSVTGVESIQTLIEDRRDLPYTGHPTSSATDPDLRIDEICRVRESSAQSATDP